MHRYLGSFDPPVPNIFLNGYLRPAVILHGNVVASDIDADFVVLEHTPSVRLRLSLNRATDGAVTTGLVQMKFFLPLFLVVFLGYTPPAFSGWQNTNWGVSVEEAQSLFAEMEIDELKKLESSNESNPYFTGVYRPSLGYGFEFSFYAGFSIALPQSMYGLEVISLEIRSSDQDAHDRCASLSRILHEIYIGLPYYQTAPLHPSGNIYQQFNWLDASSNNALTFSLGAKWDGDAPCALTYRRPMPPNFFGSY